MKHLYRQDRTLVVWWGTPIECVSALRRRDREGVILAPGEETARVLLQLLSEAWTEIQPTEKVRSRAELLLDRYPLRAADALQLAAAYRWTEEDSREEGFVCLDRRLRLAAQEEGFAVLPSGLEPIG